MEDTTIKQLEAKHVDDTERFIDAAIQNPDNDRRGGIPDLVNGPSFTRSQTISPNVVGSAVATNTYDVYIVQWDFEVLETDTCTGRYFVRSTDPAHPNLYDFNGPTFSIETGALVAYVMDSGTSPFPSKNPSVIGPVAPKSVVPLKFGSDVLSGNTRIVGSDFQVKYVGPEVTAQGIWTQSTYSSYKSFENSYFTPGASSAAIAGDQILTDTKELPPGDISSMVKYPGSCQRPAFDGVLQSAVINFHHNYPTLPSNTYKKYRGIIPTGATAHFDLFVAQHRSVVNGHVSALNNPQIWDSNCEIHYAVGTGLPKDAPLQLIRRITVETFPNPNDDLIAFAHPSPMADMVLLADVMNAFRSSQRFWAARDNALGNFSRALRKAVKKTVKVGKNVAQVAAVTNPQVAAGLESYKGMSSLAKGKKPVTSAQAEQNARDIQKLSSMIGQMKIKGENGKSSTGNLSLAAPKRKRTKPPGQS